MREIKLVLDRKESGESFFVSETGCSFEPCADREYKCPNLHPGQAVVVDGKMTEYPKWYCDKEPCQSACEK